MDSRNCSSCPTKDLALFLLRAILAVVFMYHGGQKLFGWFGGGGLEKTTAAFASMGLPMPKVNAILAGSAEFFGGVLLLLGVAVRIVVIPMAFTMLVAIWTVHRHAFGLQNKGMEYALTLGIVLIALGLLGGGNWSLMKCSKKCATPPPGAGIS